MKVLALVQARVGSSRLPKKVLRKIAGKPMIVFLLERLTHSKLINDIVLATSDCQSDNELIALAKKENLKYFRGSEDDVLDRAYHAAKINGGELIVRVTGDSPLIDPIWVDRLIQFYLDNSNRSDYAAFGKSFPEGQNAEVFSFKLLEKAWLEARLPSEREHFTSYIWTHPDKFRIFRMDAEKDSSAYRWTVDESRDLKLVRKVVRALYAKNPCFTMEEILRYVSENPDVMRLNQKIVRDEGYLLSLDKDKRK
ncbi:MAG: glycosyltransferase family protein [Candidatus Omnitrophica bacterium]|nr:glycosyltransferase family protein [Candidatus Omnitrophota bacterium]